MIFHWPSTFAMGPARLGRWIDPRRVLQNSAQPIRNDLVIVRLHHVRHDRYRTWRVASTVTRRIAEDNSRIRIVDMFLDFASGDAQLRGVPPNLAVAANDSSSPFGWRISAVTPGTEVTAS